ncbi:hypothetical protein NIES2104_46560 [Leptolyngbya sp. NIES-2104]|nr:hypothetical protein NIES2104_46560 [Leptolyngbya sp. NIES-2104]
MYHSGFRKFFELKKQSHAIASQCPRLPYYQSQSSSTGFESYV